MKKRVLSMLMALVLCLTLLPTAAFAEGADGGAASRETNSLRFSRSLRPRRRKSRRRTPWHRWGM